MNIRTLQRLIKQKKRVYNEAGNYYSRLNLYIVVPSIFITTLSSIFAFLATSDIVGKDTQNIFLILVGVLSAISTMCQSISSSVGYGTRKEVFLNAADNYDKNLIEIMFLTSEDDYDNNNNNDNNNNDNNNNDNNTKEIIEKIKENITKIEENCKYLPPNWIINKVIANLDNNIYNNERQPLLMNE